MNTVLRQFDRPTPPWVTSQLVKFGTNPYGQPLYRVVWSEGRLEKVGGTWQNRLLQDKPSAIAVTGNFIHETNPVVGESTEYRSVQRYEGKPCFMLEKWLPTSYSRSQWYELFSEPSSGICYLGPYLEHGDYHPCYRLERDGEPMPLTLAIIEYYVRLIEHGKEYTDVQRRMAIEERQRAAKREWDNRVDAVFDDSQPAFGVQAVMSGYGGKTADRVKPEDVSLASVDRLPDWVPRKPGFSQF